MAIVTLKVHFHTSWGERLLCEHASPSGPGDPAVQPIPMAYAGDGYWTATWETAGAGVPIEYRYVFRDAQGAETREPAWRRVAVFGASHRILDHWLSPEWPDGSFLRQAFAGVIFQPAGDEVVQPGTLAGRRLRITLRAPRVSRGFHLCLTGDHPILGDWHPRGARPMSSTDFPVWTADLPLEDLPDGLEFKFGLWSEATHQLVQFEAGPNRRLILPEAAHADAVTVNCESYQHPTPWKGAGVAIPVFSLLSQRGYGIGEFADLVPFADWAAGCGLQLIQLLPVNDTSNDFTWKDSYPYKAISTAALHPIYLNLDDLFSGYSEPLPARYGTRREALNRLTQVDYEQVLRDKLAWLRELYARVGPAVVRKRAFRAYLSQQAHWLRPYAAFCRLRDQHGTADFTRWGALARYPQRKIAGWFKSTAPEYGEVMFHCWLQYHLDQQLGAAVAAGHARGIAFKGDLPIGIDRSSVEAWTEPDLFLMDRETGAPPDAFAVLGQNWGFPTYNWPRMHADGYAWWRRRFQRMSTAFDALRLDHILGFFRIWEIPGRDRAGILGHFNPTLPLTREEIHAAGFPRDPHAFTQGMAADTALVDLFGDAAEAVATGVLQQGADGFWRLRPEFASAAVRQTWYAGTGRAAEATAIEDGIRRLEFEVLFLEDPDQTGHYHPRVNLADTAVFRALPSAEQVALRELHDDFYHRRHTTYWAAEGIKRLAPLLDASRMLICGEDLGMVPACVPDVLRRLGLLSLEVQRWPKELGVAFGEPAAYPYLSVTTTSTHDMPTLRGWWEEEPDARQRFWRDVMRREGAAPAECSAETCRFIVEQNLGAASLWCILPLQDWLGTHEALRHRNAAEERINVPAIPRHYWRYRMHLPLERLAEATDFNRQVAAMIRAAGRRPEGRE